MKSPDTRSRVKVRTSADMARERPEMILIPHERESDREFLERIAPMFDMRGSGMLQSQIAVELYWRLRAATA